MEIFTNNVLLDILVLCLVSMVIAVPLFSYMQKLYPEQDWHNRGSVPTSSFTDLDLIGIMAASSLFIANLIFTSQGTEPDSTTELSNFNIFIAGAISQFLPVAIACAFLLPRMNVAEIFGLKSPNIGKVALVGFAGLFVIYLCLFAVQPLVTSFLENAIGEQKLQEPVQMIIDAKENNPSLLIILAVLAVIVAPLCEEFVFRGYIYGTLKRFSGRIFATLTSALFFSVVHANLSALIPLFVVGIFLAIIYEISESLWAPILTHMLFNGMATASLIIINVEDLPV